MSKRFGFFYCFLFFLIIASGCSKLVPYVSEPSPKSIKVLRVRWVKPLIYDIPNFLIPEMTEENDRFNPIETSSAGFDTDKKRIFIGASVGGLYCLDIVTGETVWRFSLKDAVGSEPIYEPNRKAVFFGADDGKFYSLHARSGRKLWELDTGAEIRRKAILYNETLYIVNADNTVLAVDPDTGVTVWQYRRPPMKGFSSVGHAGLILSNGHLFTGFSDGYVAAIDPSVGAVIWSNDLAAETDYADTKGVVKLIDADATPVVIGDILVAASVDGGIQGMNVNNGNVMWTNPNVSGVTGFTQSNGSVIAARSDFGISSIDPKTGDILWSSEFPAGNLLDPVSYNDLLLVSDSMYGLTVLSALDGSVLQRLNQSHGFFARPSLHNGYLVVLGNGGVLYTMSIL